MAKHSKYYNVKTVVDGIKFDSKKEAWRYNELKLLERAGEITDLQVQPSFRLMVNDRLVCRYIADFSYLIEDKKYPGVYATIVEDVKGCKKGCAWEKFRIKSKLMKAIHDIDVVVI